MPPTLYLIALSFLFNSCSLYPQNFDIQGPDQFVIDSYKIREGKFSILEMEGKSVNDFPLEAMDEYKDTISDGDIFNVTLYHPTRQEIVSAVNAISSSVGYQVNEGFITLPDLSPIPIKGLTLEEARLTIEQKYLEQIQDVEVFLGYKQRLTHKVDLMGMVNLPSMPVNGKLRLYEVLASAQVPNEANLFMSYISRNGRTLPIDLNKLIKNGDFSQNIVMRGGDKIYIANPEDSKVMLMGEVAYPRTLPLTTGYVSLREALVKAGGIPYTGDKKSIQVIRGNLRHPKIYVLNWNIIVNLPNDSLLLMPGDTIYVSAKPITEWNRFLEQLLPSFGGIQTASATARTTGLQ